MTFTFWHDSLSSTLTGLESQGIVQFLGIPYGRVKRRFADPIALGDLPTLQDCTRYGPRCPQVPVDVGHLLRIPPDILLPAEPEDEFKCLNLDVTIAKKNLVGGGLLPVMVWIHGGSQAVTFGSAASGVCDMRPIIGDSIRLGTPIVTVSIQYRLNIFAVGDNTSSRNLALRDQELALDWVQKYISGFGGDPTQVTLAGESAGAVYCHAHLVSKQKISQLILSSGSLQLSPPQSPEKACSLVYRVRKQLKELGSCDLRNAPVSQVVRALERSRIQSWFLQMEPGLKGWQKQTGNAQRILLSDCRYESIIWRNGLWTTGTDCIVDAFDRAGRHACDLKRLYNISPNRPSACRQGALDFINDYKFVLPIEQLAQLWGAQGKQVYRCLIDEPNPWQPSSGAHHAVDLLHLFGGFDFSFSTAACETGRRMRDTWINFIHGKGSASPPKCVAFGPNGECRELQEDEMALRRRLQHVAYLAKAESEILDQVFASLATGKISLLN